MDKLKQIREKLADGRSGRVLFVSHCLLNVNARYLGGAFRKGSVDEIVTQAMQAGVGIVQMRCPEQHVWGGVLKKAMWMAFDSKGKPSYPFLRVFFPLFCLYTRIRYRRMAASVVRDMADYLRSGYAVAGLIGVDGSPTCGVRERLDLERSFSYFASCRIGLLDRDTFNANLYGKFLADGEGLFIEQIKRLMKKRKIAVPLYSHSLLSEMRGEHTDIPLQ